MSVYVYICTHTCITQGDYREKNYKDKKMLTAIYRRRGDDYFSSLTFWYFHFSNETSYYMYN